MSLWLIPLDYGLPILQAYLSARGEDPLHPDETTVAAELLERCIRTGEALVAFVLYVGGRPCHN